jgi:hypothetical protein
VDCKEDKHLAIALVNGTVQLMSSHLDRVPCIIDTMMCINHAAWDSSGSILAVAGASRSMQQDQQAHVIRFYDNSGVFLHQLRVARAKELHGPPCVFLVGDVIGQCKEQPV